MPQYVKHGGVWREVSPYARHGGVWREISDGYVREGGVWRQYYSAAFYGPENAGEYMHGGYYAGGNIIVGGVEYAVIIAPREYGQHPDGLQYKTQRTEDPTADSRHDGKQNANRFIDNRWPAGRYCNTRIITGYSDWHLPSRNELEICYRYLKPRTFSNFTGAGIHGRNPNSNPVGEEYTEDDPSQTSVSEFKEGSDQAFTFESDGIQQRRVWTSTAPPSLPERAWVQDFANGQQTTFSKTDIRRVRAVRWEEI